MIVLEGKEEQYQIRKMSINSDRSLNIFFAEKTKFAYRGLNISTSQKTKFVIGKMIWNLSVINVTASALGNTGRRGH